MQTGSWDVRCKGCAVVKMRNNETSSQGGSGGLKLLKRESQQDLALGR